MTAQYWPTPIFDFHCPDDIENLHTTIIAHILQEEQNSSGTFQHSVVGDSGYHSRSDLLELDTEWSRVLKLYLSEISKQAYTAFTGSDLDISKCELRSWAIILRSGDVSMTHVHPQSELSGVYYLQIPKYMNVTRGEGCLRFVDPRSLAKFSKIFQHQDLNHIPKTATGVVFPSWLEHYVMPHHRDQDRISISWNLELK